MNRVIALDIGQKRIGIAVSDPLNMFSIGLTTIGRVPEKEAIEQIRSICDDYNINKIIAGLPINMNGTSGSQVDDINKFIDKLRSGINIDICFQDERLTSVLAKKILIGQNISPSRNKQMVDKKAAELILQQYLDSNANKE